MGEFPYNPIFILFIKIVVGFPTNLELRVFAGVFCRLFSSISSIFLVFDRISSVYKYFACAYLVFVSVSKFPRVLTVLFECFAGGKWIVKELRWSCECGCK